MDILEYINKMQEMYGDVVKKPGEIERPQQALDREMFENFNIRNPKAGGGMLIKPSFGDMREGFKTDYDVRVMVLNNEIVGQLKRPIVSGDFRSNVSQGSLPLKMKLTELEKSEILKAAKSVNGIWLGVDFIPSKDREKIPPYLIEVNSSPGTGHIDEMNGTDISKLVLDTFKNRDNWTLDK